MTAIAATFADFKTVKTRSTAQFIFELPIEQADAALKLLGGIPIPGKEPWVGIAPLDLTKAKEPPAADAKPKERWHEMKRAKQAGILCGRADFQAFLGVRSTITDDMTAKQIADMREEDAARHLRQRLGLTSRRQIDDSTETAGLFDALVRSYREATGQETEERG